MLTIREDLELRALHSRAEEWFTVSLAWATIAALFFIVVAAGWCARPLPATIGAIDLAMAIGAAMRYRRCRRRIRDLEGLKE